MPGSSDVTQAATMCATLVDEWVASGVRHAIVAPGSRSTPMALALLDHPHLRVSVMIDERSAAFVALGLGLDGIPAVLLCTSGTAAVNFHPAVVEADLSAVPMIVVTADRPPELRGVGAPQTIDQVELYGRSVRWFADVPPAEDSDPATWRPLARRARRAAADGPVHVNLAFREPLLGRAGTLPAGGDESADPSSGSTRSPVVDPVPVAVDVERGVIIAGGRADVPAAAIARLAEVTGWPILADPTSPARALDGVVTAADPILRHREFAAAHHPAMAIRIGRPPASRVVSEWLRAADCPIVQVGGPGVIDPEGLVMARCRLDDLLERSWTAAAGTPWAARWRHAERRAQEALAAVWQADDRLTEPLTARLVADHRRDAELVAASSMPIRDLEWYGGSSARAHANRGANGIDGTLSTALGRALCGVPVTVLIGDLALVHDSNALVAITSRPHVSLRIVVVDNDGGGIFSFLPQGTDLDDERFETLFGTPHHTDLERLAAAHGVAAVTVASADELIAALDHRSGGVGLIRVASDRRRNRDDHRQLNESVARALDTRP